MTKGGEAIGAQRGPKRDAVADVLKNHPNVMLHGQSNVMPGLIAQHVAAAVLDAIDKADRLASTDYHDSLREESRSY